MPVHEPALQLDNRFSHLVEADGSFVLVGDEESVVLEGAFVPELMRHIDGRRTAVDVANALADTHRPDFVHFAILRLLGDGLLAEVEPEEVGGAFKLFGGSLAERLHGAWIERGDKPAILPISEIHTVAMVDDYLHPNLADAVDQLRSSGRRVTLIRPAVPTVWIGPTFDDEPGACLSCLQERLRLNLTGRAFLHSETRRFEDAGPETREAIRIDRLPRHIPASYFDDIASRVEGLPSMRSITAVARGESATVHRVPKLPHCPACGDPSLVPAGADLALESRPIVNASSGGTRVCTPQETLDRYAHLISPLTGIVRRIERVEVDEEQLIHVFTASHAGNHNPSSVKAVKDDARDHSGGKGVTELDARVSALCESLERYSAAHRGTEPVRMARESELGDSAIGPQQLLQFSMAQYLNRHEWNAQCAGHFQRVPEPYEDQPIDWSPFRSLRTGTVHWLPSAHLYHGFRGTGREFCRGDSNGLAGGNCIEEAILQGFLELVERDAIALWWYNRTLMPGAPLHDWDDPFIQAVSTYHDSIGRRLWTLDLTTDLGIPCLATLSARRTDGPEDIVFGFGCHPNPAVALRRSVTEANQMLPAVLRSQRERERQLLPDFADAIAWWNEATCATHPYLELAGGEMGTAWERFESHRNIKGLLLECVSRAERAGLDVLAHDLTRVDVGLHVAKVVVPGLRHFWRRTGPGRLYDVPVSLGRLERPLDESELNSVSMFA